MEKHIPFTLIAVVTMAISCNDHGSTKTTTEIWTPGTLGYDVQFLQQHDSIIMLRTGDAYVIVSPKYQAKVFTSGANGMYGKSFGWINYKAFTAPTDAHMNAYGGENRFWLGPEGGKYSLFFPEGAEMVFANWKTPAAFDTEAWQLMGKDALWVSMRKQMQLNNYAGSLLSISAERSISILAPEAVATTLQLTFDTSITAVGYQTVNTITNSGLQAWDQTTGMPCIWMLDMLKPSDETVIVIPYKTNGDISEASIARTNYFGEIPKSRIKYKNGVLLFKADGKSRGKLDIAPVRTLPVAGSYDAQNQVLTITLFDVDNNGRYLNQVWNTKEPPFSGAAVNAYNDGPLDNGSQMGPFYELESVSPAAFLQPGQSLTHKHAVFHFTGNEQELDNISKKVLHISLEEIKKAF